MKPLTLPRTLCADLLGSRTPPSRGARLWELAILVVSLACPFVPRASAQDIRPGDRRLELPDFRPPEAERGTILPPLELPREPDSEGLSAGVRVFVRHIHFEGVSVLSDEQLEELAAPNLNRDNSFADLEALRDRVTLSYVDQGYVTSGAVIPDQTVREGVLTVQVVEGVLEDIDVETNGRFRESYIRVRLERAARGPVNVQELEKRLQILQQDPRIRSVHASLLPGDRLGRSVLRVRVDEAPPYWVRLEGNNYQSTDIGAAGGTSEFAYTNLTGFGDSLRVAYTGTEGLNEIAARYEIPINSYDTTVELHMRHTWSEVVEDPFESLDIESRTQTYGITLTQPVYRSLGTGVDLFVTGEYRRSKSYLLGSGFSFVPGPKNGVAKIAVVRFGQSFTHRTRDQAFSARSMLSFGLNALGATKNSGNIPDGQFVSWLGQLQWATRLPFLGAQLLTRGDVQLTGSPLLGLEQFAVGGRYTVRGYRENTLVRDNGLLGSLELRVPVWSSHEGDFRLELVPFVDAGYSWSEDRPTVGPTTLVSVGIGARATITPRVHFEAYWGEPLKDVPDVGDWDLQSDGVHLGLTVGFP